MEMGAPRSWFGPCAGTEPVTEGRSMFCCECGHEMKLSSEPITEQFRGEKITVEGIERYVCDKCGNDVMSAAMATKLSMALSREYAKRRGLLSPEEIKRIRKSLQLTQDDFETMVGISSPTACRWERGTSPQSRTADLLLRALRDLPDMADYLKFETGLATGTTSGSTAFAGCMDRKRAIGSSWDSDGERQSTWGALRQQATNHLRLIQGEAA